MQKCLGFRLQYLLWPLVFLARTVWEEGSELKRNGTERLTGIKIYLRVARNIWDGLNITCPQAESDLTIAGCRNDASVLPRDWIWVFLLYLGTWAVRERIEMIFFQIFAVVKIRLQQQRGLASNLLKYRGPIHCAKTIVQEEGMRGLWAGAAPTIMRNGLNQATMFTAKNAIDVVLWNKHEGDGKTLQPWQSMVSGFLAGATGPICTGPFDVVKTRLMAQMRTASGSVKYKGMIHAMKTIYQEEGLPALWKGLVPRLMRIPPGQAIMWTVADQVVGFYEQRFMTIPQI